MKKLTLAVSSCLLGEEVRYNGGHKRHRWLTECLGKYADFVPFCPEVAIGMGIPRTPIRLIQTDSDVRAIDTENLTDDYTEALRDYALQVVPQLESIDGYVLMQGSPSCGMERVKLYDKHMISEKTGTGIFARVIKDRLPWLPMEESGRLTDVNLVENFVQRLYVYHRWRTEQPWRSAKTLIEFHARQKYLLMMHDYEAYKTLGQMLLNLKDKERLENLGHEYMIGLMEALKKIPERGHRMTVLQHMMGYFKQQLTKEEKASILHAIEQYRAREVPFIVPVSMLKHYIFLHGDQFPYLLQQTVLNPYPEALELHDFI